MLRDRFCKTACVSSDRSGALSWYFRQCETNLAHDCQAHQADLGECHLHVLFATGKIMAIKAVQMEGERSGLVHLFTLLLLQWLLHLLAHGGLLLIHTDHV